MSLYDHSVLYVVTGIAVRSDKQVTEIQTEDPDEILRYIAHRHRHHERLRVLGLTIGPNTYLRQESEDYDAVVLTYYLNRVADDLRLSNRISNGKAVINCGQQKITRWVYSGQGYLDPPERMRRAARASSSHMYTVQGQAARAGPHPDAVNVLFSLMHTLLHESGTHGT